ncbi:fimbrial protein [Paraburkholderia dinghuensis]|uniref:Type 1 fimbrial protein n=1 Tax=Paraburkholderia dinghuensis TaxID=2305225 RepID=A0A3N6M9X1_9BURK|nr:fimbrial protein [Paraburkholderia dinghuensis]RQH00574.1 type 1 fimbrial protein [Paraburkholderia dinghuensis]
MRIPTNFCSRPVFWLLTLLVVVITTIGSTRAHAQTCYQGSLGPEDVTITLPATVTIPRDAPAGTILAQGTVAFTNGPGTTNATNVTQGMQNLYGVYCSTSANLIYSNLIGGASANGVMPTSLSGIGFSISGSTGTVLNTGTTTLAASAWSNCGTNVTYCVLILSNAITVKLIKTGPVTGMQVFPAGEIFSATIGGLPLASVSIASPVQVIGQTCTVTTPSVLVSLGTVPLKTFTSVGSASSPVPFQIGLDCSGVTTNVGVTFTDITNPGNTTSNLSLTGDSTATGVGIQIMNSGSPVQYGADASVAGNPGQIMLGTVSNASQNLAFAGRYVQTGSTVTPGVADGIATFTMSYQ